MAKFILQRKLYNQPQQVEEQQQQVPVSTTGQEIKSAAISTLAPMAITGAINAYQGASKGTKAAALGTLAAGALGYAAHKGYLGQGAQGLANKAISYGQNLAAKFKPATTPASVQPKPVK